MTALQPPAPLENIFSLELPVEAQLDTSWNFARQRLAAKQIRRYLQPC
jgi:hypothetical protein